MARAYNFCAGPAALPEAVLQQAQAEMLDYQGKGLSVMEMSHRSTAFVEIAQQAEQDLRELMNINDDYAVLFMQGGASLQFSAIPLNLLSEGQTADYIVTGQWSKKAQKEAARFGNARVAASSEADGFTSVPAQSDWQLSDKAAYVHYASNETIGGVEFPFIPETEAPLVADMSSNILSEPVDVSRFGLIYAGAQKNIGPAGIVVVIVRRDLLGRAAERTPTLLEYQVVADKDSMYNTPPTYSWYLSGLVFKWLKEQGGLEEVAAKNARKAEKLYAAIDASDFYSNPVAKACRSRMNIPFVLANSDLDKTFLAEADAAGLLNLKGHRSVGGMRASLYNAMPEEGVDALIDFMTQFEKAHG